MEGLVNGAREYFRAINTTNFMLLNLKLVLESFSRLPIDMDIAADSLPAGAMVVPQKVYTPARPTAAVKPLADPIRFNQNGEHGIRLVDALAGNIYGMLDAGTEVEMPYSGQKICIRILVRLGHLLCCGGPFNLRDFSGPGTTPGSSTSRSLDLMDRS